MAAAYGQHSEDIIDISASKASSGQRFNICVRSHTVAPPPKPEAASLFDKSDAIQNREQEEAEILDRVDNRLGRTNNAFVHDEDVDFKLHVTPSLAIIICTNSIMLLSYFIIVSSSNAYAVHLGGSATFAGLAVGIPSAVSGFCSYRYAYPLHFSCSMLFLGSLLYGLAYKTGFLYLILIGRMVTGIGYTFFMYSKKYCSDPRVVGVRRRTLLAGWLVLGQSIGLSAGPFLGGSLFRIGFSNDFFNGFSSPGLVVALVFLIHWAVVAVWFRDPPKEGSVNQDIELSPDSSGFSNPAEPSLRQSDKRQWGVIITMCWVAMVNFFILGAWESGIPAFSAVPSPMTTDVTASAFNMTAYSYNLTPRGIHRYPAQPFQWSPYAAGNFLALGGISIFPFLFLNMFLARRTQDRHVLVLGWGLGLFGLLIASVLLASQPAHGSLTFGSFFVCWFLVALGFNLATTSTLSLLSKRFPPSWNGKTSLFVQYSNNVGRVSGAVWGGSGVKIGMVNNMGLQIAIVGFGAILFTTLWKELKAKTG